MAAVIENTENGQLGNNLTYSQSSDGSHHLSETLLDPSNPSAKTVDFNPGQKVNGLSHVDEDLQLQKTGANILGPGTVKADPQHTLINCSVVKTEIDFGEKPKTEEVAVAVLDVEGQPTLSRSVQDEIPLPEARSSPSTKDEEKVECKVPLDSKSNYSSSIQNAANKLSLWDDVDGTKESSVSGIEEQKSEIDSKISECKTTEPLHSLKNTNDKELVPLISESKSTIITSTLEDKNLQSNFADNKLFKSVENISLNGNMDSIHLQEEKTTKSSKSVTDPNATVNKDSDDISTFTEEKTSEKNNLKNSSESSDCQNYSDCISNSKTDKSSGVSNIPELLSYCSPCQVVVQDFFKELNIDLLELSRNFPVHHSHRKRLKNSKSVPSTIPGKEKIKNNLFDSLDRTKQAKCYTENSKRRKKHLTQESERFKETVEDEDEEDNLPLLSVRNNLTQAGNTAADTKKSETETKSNDNDDKITEGENLTIPTKGDNSDATEERSVTNCISSDLQSSTSTNIEAADSFPKMSVINVPPTVNLSDSNDLGLKIVSVSSQGSVFFPAFTNDNSENIVFNHPDTAPKLNGELDATCENSTTKLSPPKCKFHGPNSSPVQNLYKCKKCGLEAKSLSDIQAHMAGSHSEFCMYRCPFCIPPLPVKRVGIFNNRPIEFEVLRESTRKLTTSPPSTKTSSSSMSSKRKMPRHIRIQCEKRRKLNYYYRNQREIKKYKNEKVSCQYCHKEINQSNISRHQNSKICTNPEKNKKRSLILRDMIPTKYQKVKCNTCQKSISRTNLSKHSRICPKENDD